MATFEGQAKAGSVFCSICLETVADRGERSVAKLKCGHYFHLDCIGSAFNSKGAMQCPNCRQVEQGQWLFANGCLHEDSDDDLTLQVHYEMYGGISNLVHHQDEMFVHMPWCPYQESHPQFSVPLGERNNPESRYSSIMANARHNMRHTHPGHNSPYLAAENHSSGVAPPLHYERNVWPYHFSITLASASSSTSFDGATHSLPPGDRIRYLQPAVNRGHQQTGGHLFQNPLFTHPGVQQRPNGGASMSSGTEQLQNHGFEVHGSGSFQPLGGSASHNEIMGRCPQSLPSSSGHMESSSPEGCWGPDQATNWGSTGPCSDHLGGGAINWHAENQVESWIRGQAYTPRGPFGIHHWWTWVPPIGGSSESIMANRISSGYLAEHFQRISTTTQDYSGH